MKNADTLFLAGAGKQCITPLPGVELAGLGYYLKREWQSIHDDLYATALIISDTDAGSAAFVALDLMMMDADAADEIRNSASARTGLLPESICINCSHSHSAPTLAFFDGAGEINEQYRKQVIDDVVDLLERTWQNRVPARLYTGKASLPGISYNRTREGGPVDERISVLRADTLDGKPLAIAANFHAHPTVFWRVDGLAVSRDWPGQLVDLLETSFPGCAALYLQGSCGDSNILLEYWTPEQYRETGPIIFEGASRALASAREIRAPGVQSSMRQGRLPTRPWERDEVMTFYDEGTYRLRTGDTAGWLDGIARFMSGTPELLPTRYGGSVDRAVEAVSRFAVRWSEHVLPSINSQSEERFAAFQATRIGDVWFVANPAEFFSSLALEIRARWPHDDLFILGYSNGSVSYLPDAYEVDQGSYASLHVPKGIRQQPFTRDAGIAAVQESLAVLAAVGTGPAEV